MLMKVGTGFRFVAVDWRTPGRVTVDRAIPSTWLFAPSKRGGVRVGTAGFDVIASTRDDQVRVAAFFAASNSFDLFTTRIHSKLLAGLQRLDVASIWYDGTWLSIVLTAQIDSPTAGTTSVGAILRVTSSGTRHLSYGDEGLWVGPRSTKLRPFTAAGLWPGGFHPGGVVGIHDSDMVAIGVAPSGDAVDASFGVNGILRHSLGGALTAPVTTSYGQYVYLFARRDDGRVVGSRFNRQGILDLGFGDAGLAIVPSDAEKVTPADVKVASTRVGLAVTREVDGVNCERGPEVVFLNASTAQPDSGFGASGFAFQAAVGEPAVVCPNGVSYYAERRAAGGTMNLRRTDSNGRFDRVLPLTVPITNKLIQSLYALDDSSLLVAGVGDKDWICKLTTQGDLDPSYGTNGVAFPGRGMPSGSLEIVGVRPGGTTAVWFEAGVGLLDTAGALDTTWGPPDDTGQGLDGLVPLKAFRHLIDDTPTVHSTATPFLDADGSILCVASSSRETTAEPAVRLGLRRIKADGYYDPDFGLGLPSARQPDPGQHIRVGGPLGSTDPEDSYGHVTPVGCAWLGGLLYVVAHGEAGIPTAAMGRGFPVPTTGVLIVTRWTAQGLIDYAWATGGRQEAGWRPNRLDYRPAGVLLLPPKERVFRRGARPAGDPELIVFGTAGRSVTESRPGTGGIVNTVTVTRRPEPAYFQVAHPDGIDPNPPEYLQMQEFQAAILAARILPPASLSEPHRLRVVCGDRRTQPPPKGGLLMSNFGGVGQFAIGHLKRLEVFAPPAGPSDPNR